jgi:hypothetical protein
MQTWLVHMRTPMTLMHDMGFVGFVAFQLLVGGTVLAALVHPIFLAALVIRYLSGGFAAIDGTAGGVALAALYGATFVAGYMATLVLAWVGLARRKLLSYAPTLLLVPVLWILLSVAAWRALIQLSYAPYRWDKTEHGFAKTSRQRRKSIWPKPPSSSPGSVYG